MTTRKTTMNNSKTTRTFFNQWDDYHRLVNQLDSYQFISAALRGELRGHAVDVGNGGVFNYDVPALEKLVIVDIAEDLTKKTVLAPNVSFQYGNAVALPLDTGQFDTVLLQLILHHLAEYSVEVTRERSQRAIAEAWRVLKPGGRLVILESCLPKYWEIMERWLFPAFSMFLTRLGHPLVFQWNWNSLADFCREAGFAEVLLTRVPQGRWIIQLGRKWPTALTPIQIYKLVAHKPAN